MQRSKAYSDMIVHESLWTALLVRWMQSAIMSLLSLESGS